MAEHVLGTRESLDSIPTTTCLFLPRPHCRPPLLISVALEDNQLWPRWFLCEPPGLAPVP